MARAVEYRVAFIDVGSRSYHVEKFSPPNVLGPIDAGLEISLNAKNWEKDPLSPESPFFIGRGVFAGGRIPGSHRMIAVFRSPLTRGLHVSALGGAAYRFVGTGLHGLAITGKSSDPLVVVVKGGERGLEKIDFIELGEHKLKSIFEGYAGRRGVFALTLYLYDTCREVFEKGARSIVVGPAAASTLMGGIFSIDFQDLRRGKLSPGAVDSAARGGPGSALYQGHGVAGIVFGGSYSVLNENPRLGDPQLLDRISERVYGKRFTAVLVEKTKKYRYDPKLETGGTFGVNYVHYRDLIPVFAYNMVYFSKQLRLRILYLIIEWFWRPFQREVFESQRKPWYTCGEPCPVVCKKVWRGLKIDYEPFNALGPLSGVMRLEDAAKLVELADSLGFDAIELGHVVSWIMDLLHRGLLEPQDVGVEEKPCFDPLSYEVSRCSARNAAIAEKIVQGLVKGDGVLALIGRHGARTAAKRLNKLFEHRVRMVGLGFHDLLVYAAFGSEGYMTPNLYWTPGMVAPLYILGRYWTNYSPTFMEPEEYAKSSLNRAVWEYNIDNAGFCRFHRGWAERVLGELFREVWGVDVDLAEHARRKYRLIIDYQRRAAAEPVPWESRKTIDLVAGIAAEVGVMEWAEKLAASEAAREWWERFHKTLLSLLGAK